MAGGIVPALLVQGVAKRQANEAEKKAVATFERWADRFGQTGSDNVVHPREQYPERYAELIDLLKSKEANKTKWFDKLDGSRESFVRNTRDRIHLWSSTTYAIMLAFESVHGDRMVFKENVPYSNLTLTIYEKSIVLSDDKDNGFSSEAEVTISDDDVKFINELHKMYVLNLPQVVKI